MDRRFLLAMVLFMVIIIGPSLIFKRRAPVPPGVVDSTQVVTPPAPDSAPVPVAPAPRTPAPDVGAVSEDTLPADTVFVSSALYRYGVSTRGARLVEATLAHYAYTIKGRQDEPVELLRPGSDLLALRLLVGTDTVPLDEWVFRPSVGSLEVDRPETLKLTAQRGEVRVTLDYRFVPDSYQVAVSGKIEGLGPNGGLLLIGLGPGIANTEANLAENQRSMGYVVRTAKGTSVTRFAKLDPGEERAESGPFDWVGVKTKYFVAAVLSIGEGTTPFSGLSVAARSQEKNPDVADVWASLPVTSAGDVQYRVYAGPMEYPRLAAVGHDFDDVNPYGWPGFRSLIHPVAIGVRWLLVWMHENLHLAYGFVLIAFGLLVRIVLWPLNQKAMRASIRMQAVQPLMKEIQERHKENPQKLQQEMFKLYKEHKVNPLGGCWPMLLPFPVLIALFFVFQNTIELRGVSFMWLPDLSQKDPLYIIPLLMGISMFSMSKVGQIGVEPNPQMKMMLYVMPGVMTILFANFASGLNLYYTVQNMVGIPQQWYLAHERLRLNPPKPKAAEPAETQAQRETGPRPKQKKLKKRR